MIQFLRTMEHCTLDKHQWDFQRMEILKTKICFQSKHQQRRNTEKSKCRDFFAKCFILTLLNKSLENHSLIFCLLIRIKKDNTVVRMFCIFKIKILWQCSCHNIFFLFLYTFFPSPRKAGFGSYQSTVDYHLSSPLLFTHLAVYWGTGPISFHTIMAYLKSTSFWTFIMWLDTKT